MKVSEAVSKLEMELQESQNARDKRVEELWRKLDPMGRKELDFKGLQKGLKRIDHPLKNADDMLQDIIKVVDTSGDGKIQYEEFRVFVEAAERQLLFLFQSIDRDRDGRLNKDELRAAFQRAGLAVPLRRLNGFFDKIDMDHDGFITFHEWRDFLLFMPPQGDGSPLETALSYYSSVVVTNAEGDSLVSEETLEGLGTTGVLLQALFGSILKLAQPAPLESAISSTATKLPAGTSTTPTTPNMPLPASSESAAQPRHPQTTPSQQRLTQSQIPPPLHSGTHKDMPASVASKPSTSIPSPSVAAFAGIQATQLDSGSTCNKQQQLTPQGISEMAENKAETKSRLTRYLPEPGYFVAGALAGGISRTATAPLDRLKVYLLVNTNSAASASLDAAKHGHPLAALRNAGRPIGEAVVSLYKVGGLRTFFAGNGLNVVKIMPETAIKFGSYEAIKRALANFEGHGDPNHISGGAKFVAGGFAGMVAQACVYPLDTLKFRLQCETVQGGPKGNALLAQTAKKMLSEGAFRVAYRGLTMGLIGMFPYSAIDMGIFELLKSAYIRYRVGYCGVAKKDAAPGNIVTGLIGATSGGIGASVVYPLNVLRTRLQTQGTVMHPATYTGIWDVGRKTLRHEGARGLYKGLTPNLLKVAPALSITWIVYENSKKILGLP